MSIYHEGPCGHSVEVGSKRCGICKAIERNEEFAKIRAENARLRAALEEVRRIGNTRHEDECFYVADAALKLSGEDSKP